MNSWDSLQPTEVWSIFNTICKIPHPSKHEKELGTWIKSWADGLSIDYKEDETGNLLLKSPSSPGCEDYPTLILQAHIDMVCAIAEDKNFDCTSDSITPLIRDRIVTADGTTLGADNGIGVAYCLAAAASKKLKHGPLEILLTVGEEVGFTGAFALKDVFFTGKFLLNLDSEDLGLITIGTSGGVFTDYYLTPEFEVASGLAAVELKIQGLTGGHSGIHIHLPRLNAIKVIAEPLLAIHKKFGLNIFSFNGGAAVNAIPSQASSTFGVDEKRVEAVIDYLDDWKTKTEREAKDKEPNIIINFASTAKPEKAINRGQSEKLLHLLNELPHGPVTYSKEIKDLVQTSNNVGKITTNEAEIKIQTSTRSSVEDELDEQQNLHKGIGRKYKAAIKQHARYPAWTAQPKSPFNQLVRESYEQVMERRVELKAYHAGLECGLFKGIDPELEMASIGPNIRNVHSPEEEVEIESVGVIWEVIKNIAESMDKIKK